MKVATEWSCYKTWLLFGNLFFLFLIWQVILKWDDMYILVNCRHETEMAEAANQPLPDEDDDDDVDFFYYNKKRFSALYWENRN